MKSSIFSVIIFLFFLSCNDEISIETKKVTVEGKLNHRLTGSTFVNVNLIGTRTYQTVTDSSGYFIVTNVEKVNYLFSYDRQLSDSSFVSNVLNISITDDTLIDKLELPKPVLLYPIKNSSITTAEISWSKCSFDSFYEYKVFKSQKSGLDENHGELIHVSTEIDDTIFIDNDIIPNTKYFYRVFVMNKFGKLGGSKILENTSLNGNILLNSSFEYLDIDSTISDWWYTNIRSYFEIVFCEDAPEGDRALEIIIPQYYYALTTPDFSQQVNEKYLGNLKKYKLSVYAKIIEMSANAQCFVEFYTGDYIPQQRIVINASNSKNEWKNYLTTFYLNISDNVVPEVRIFNMCTIPFKGEPYHILLDKIELINID